MNERSIQIWFQNRRAKVKHMQKRAHMQMHQAAMRAQFYQHYPHSFDNDSFMKQPFYFPPHYMIKQPMMDYNIMKSTTTTPPPRSTFSTPEPPMYYSTPPPHFPTAQENHWHSSTPPFHSSPVIDSSVSYQQQLFEKDFLSLDHGPISPSPTPKEDSSPSPTTTHQENEFFSMPSNTIEDKIIPEPSLFSESEMWISTPGKLVCFYSLS
jgi:hypothetical protein